MRVGASLDRMAADEQEAAFMRLATPLAKYWVCKRQPGFVYEALECHGGAGYVEEGPMPRLYRQSPLNAIWEGSGNVMCLDVLGSLAREPEALEAVRSELTAAKGANAAYDTALSKLDDQFTDLATLEVRARSVVETLATLAAAAILIKGAPAEVSEAYCASRLGDGRHGTFGELDPGTDFRAITERALAV